MPPRNTTMGTGELFVEMDGKKISLGKIQEIEITTEPEFYEDNPHPIVTIPTSATFETALHIKRMSRKRCIKLLMSRRYRRNEAQAIAAWARKCGLPYFVAVISMP